MNSKCIISHMYPNELSIYGDMGNILAMKYMLRQCGWEYEYHPILVGQTLPEHTDFMFIGGGQDVDQMNIVEDINLKKIAILEQVNDGMALLAICGGYQLLGEEFIDGKGRTATGLSIFPVKTKSLDSTVSSRCIGNIVVDSEQFGTLVGFENHGGQTFFTQKNNKAKPLGKVLYGNGNNSHEKLEGCVIQNAIGTYLHGSCLPKNPEITKWFINQMLERKVKKGHVTKKFATAIMQLTQTNYTLAARANKVIVDRYVSNNIK